MPAAEAAALILVCVGGGDAVKFDQSTVTGTVDGSYDYGRGRFDGDYSGTITGTRTQDYAEQVDVEIFGEEGRIRLPRVTLPAIRGGDDGWFKMSDVSMTERTITAKARVNFINKPRVHIDRVTGTISITGKGGTFVGNCQKVEAEEEAQF